jgi:3-methyladenine DNA glycosylase AlkD
MDHYHRVKEIREALQDLSTPQRRERTLHYISTSQEVLGVSNPDVRGLIKALRKQYTDYLADQWVSLSKELVQTGIFECQICGFELIAGNSKALNAMGYQDAVDLMLNLDNWASVDHYTVGIFGVLWGRGVVEDRHIEALLDSEVVWDRRVAVVSTVALNTASRGGSGDTFRTLWVCERVVDERHPMIWKALSWALRSLIRWDREAVYGFLDDYRNRLSRQVIREVEHKLEFGTKN